MRPLRLRPRRLRRVAATILWVAWLAGVALAAGVGDPGAQAGATLAGRLKFNDIALKAGEPAGELPAAERTFNDMLTVLEPYSARHATS
jgi:hypothetical protein